MARTYDIDQEIERDVVEVPFTRPDGTKTTLKSRPMLSTVTADVDKLADKTQDALDKLDLEYTGDINADIKTSDDLDAPVAERIAADKRLRARNAKRGEIIEKSTYDRLAILLRDENGEPVDVKVLAAALPYRVATRLVAMIQYPDLDEAGGPGNAVAGNSEASPADQSTSTS